MQIFVIRIMEVNFMRKFDELTEDDLISVKGGFNKTAYKWGRYTRKGVDTIMEVSQVLKFAKYF